VTAAALVADLEARGLRLELDGSRIVIERAEGATITREDIKAIRSMEPEIISVLRRPTPARTFPWPDELPGLGVHAVGPFARCARCIPGRWAGRATPGMRIECWGEAGTWTRYGETPLCLRHALELEEVRA